MYNKTRLKKTHPCGRWGQLGQAWGHCIIQSTSDSSTLTTCWRRQMVFVMECCIYRSNCWWDGYSQLASAMFTVEWGVVCVYLGRRQCYPSNNTDFTRDWACPEQLPKVSVRILVSGFLGATPSKSGFAICHHPCNARCSLIADIKGDLMINTAYTEHIYQYQE